MLVTLATLNNLNQAIADVGPSGVVEIVGEHSRKTPYFITAGGAPSQPVTIRGGIFRGNRADPWTPGAVDGQPYFQLGPEASWLTFEDQTFANVGNGCYQLGAPLQGLTFEGFTARNVQRFIENRVIAGQTVATVDGLTIRTGTVEGFSKGAIRLQYDTCNVYIGDVYGDSKSVDGDDLPIGAHLSGTVHDVIVNRVTMNNCYQDNGDQYWNGDGFASERGTFRLAFTDSRASGCTDAGWDLKGDDHLLTRCVAWDNKRNFRLWGRATLVDCVGLDPRLRGGTGTQAQVHTTETATVEVVRGVFSDASPKTIIFDADGTSTLTATSAGIWRHGVSRLSTEETNASVIVGEIAETLRPVSEAS